ncbi:MAG TPA: hypothetical protein ENI34_02345 [candidate division WOR-3 bacterium]|uniref:Uncharacterized protein n=1 Tax=candidate division WOR-3 bacterium TaxID=2052148 RepID=A0A9C9JZJ4_UNCW3|nr:hypothetical protein [candidate division WOR-3 bacterium]
MIMSVNNSKDSLQPYEIIATGATGRMIHKKTGLEVKSTLGGPEGGDLQIRVCDVHNIPRATNLASAEILLKGLQSK